MKKLSFSRKFSMTVFLMTCAMSNQTLDAGEKPKEAAYLSNWKGNWQKCFELVREKSLLQWKDDKFNMWFLVDDVIQMKDVTDCGSASLVITESPKGQEISSPVNWKKDGDKRFQTPFTKPSDNPWVVAFTQALSSPFRLAFTATGRGQNCELATPQYLVSSPDIIYIPSNCFSGEKKVNFFPCGGSGTTERTLNEDGTGYLKLEKLGMTDGSCHILNIAGREKSIEIKAVASSSKGIERIGRGNLLLEAYRHINTP
jgi:hypothetical protein